LLSKAMRSIAGAGAGVGVVVGSEVGVSVAVWDALAVGKTVAVGGRLGSTAVFVGAWVATSGVEVG
jgi:uncharacterized membrane protein YczE